MIVLASASPQRARLLAEAGVAFTVDPADIDETVDPAQTPLETAVRLARGKALAVAARRPGAWVIGGDTVVAARGEILGKPADEADARRMLTLLGGTRHEVATGNAVALGDRVADEGDRAFVTMRPLTGEEMDAYVASGAWRGKAGGYGLQNDDPFVTAVEGRRDTIVGLTIPAVRRLLTRMQDGA